ncbi:MAG TPA: 2Fe-2S iron-sulfur cluster-binding protein [Planctomycetota bacterium]
MGGTNPYVKAAPPRRPTRKYTITFQPTGEVVEVDPTRVPYGRTGLAGSILDVALAHDVDIDHACGGVLACSTCHVIVRQGSETCGEASDDEMDQLEKAPGIEERSRLACQCVADGSRDLVVEVPNWNRNLVSERPH